MKQYLELVKRIVDEGEWVYNERTQTNCLTLINADMVFDVGNGEFPILTTRKTNFRGAIGEMLAYLRGYTNVADFHKLGVKTWDANANNPVWLDSIYRQGEGDLGKIYGAAGNVLPHIEYSRTEGAPKLWINFAHQINWLEQLIEKIKQGKDDRGLIWNFWNPSYFHLGCLRPCMYSHQFSLVNGTLYLNSTARSQDVLLGTVFNMIQVYFLLWVMAKLTNKKPGKAFFKLVNCHIYDNQYEVLLAEKQLEREPYPAPTLHCSKPITLDSVLGRCENEEDNLHPNDFTLVNYQYHPSIKYPFTV